MYRLAGQRRAPQKGALFAFWVLLLHACLLSLAEAGQCLPFRADEWVKVNTVYDGDTVRLSDGRKVRFVGINTPEIGHDGEPSDPLAEEARQALQQLVGQGQRIALRYDQEREDRYGRLLAHLYLSDQTSLQERLLEQGFAAAVAIAPNVANLDCYLAAEARAGGRGIWQEPRYRGIEVEKLSRQARGFYILQGKVERIGESRKALWLNFSNRVAVRINREDLSFFKEIDLKQLRGKRVRVRGWLSEWRGELQMRIYHPASLQPLD